MAISTVYPKSAIYQVVITANPSSGLNSDAIEVGANTFTFAATADPPFQVAYGANAAAAAANLVAAINALDAGDDNYFIATHVGGAASTAAQTILLQSTIVGVQGSDLDNTVVDSADTPIAVTAIQEADEADFAQWIADLLRLNQINAEVRAELLRPFGGALPVAP